MDSDQTPMVVMSGSHYLTLIFSTMGHFVASFRFPLWVCQGPITTFLDLMISLSFTCDFGYIFHIRY